MNLPALSVVKER